MKTFLRHLWEKLRSSFWFIPGLFVILAIGASNVLVAIDAATHADLAGWLPKLTKASPDGVRSLLSTVGTSMLTLAGLAFSATLVALSLASGQFGPRLLRNFIRSRTNQATLGILLGNFVFSLIVLRSTGNDFIPHLAAFAAFLLALCGLGAFILFVHSIVSSIQAERVVADVYEELDQAVERFFPDALPSEREERDAESDAEDWEELKNESCIESERGGYLQVVDLKVLLKAASELNIRLRVVKRPGQFIHTGEDLVAFPGDQGIDESARKKLRDCFLIGSLRTAEQDFEFFVRQLVEVALRALSPGINDPFTAMNCIDFLSEALAKISRRQLPRRVFCCPEGDPRVVTRPTSFQSIMDTAFLQLRQASAQKPDVVISLLDALARVAESASIGEQKEVILAHAGMIAGEGVREATSDFDREAIGKRLDRIREICGSENESSE